MCGFAGIFEYGRANGSVSAGLVIRMRDTLIHRGPDGEGVWVSPDRRVGMGHRRLAIVDIEHGMQPMFSDRRECLVFNGEIYNYPELRRELERDGVVFRTNCDTEVILHLYGRHGVACLNQLSGMFAFALWDPAMRCLMLARDRVGEKPLYWADAGGCLVFGSEIKAVLEHPLVHAEVNRAALAPYLANLTTPSPETLFAGIYKLSAGTLAMVDGAGVKVRRYWDLFSPREFAPLDMDTAADRVLSLLDASVHARLMSDGPVGVLLSGGLDSTTLVALLRERAAGLATFSVGFHDHSGIDERAESRRVAAHFHTAHHEVVVSEQDAIDFLPRLVHHQDEPLADPVCLPLHFVCELAQRSGVKVVLAGEGADELFWGYPRYRRAMANWRWLRLVLGMPGPARRALPRAVPAGRHPYIHELLEGLASGRPPPANSPLGLSKYQRGKMLSGTDGGLTPGWRSSTAGESRGAERLQQFAFDTQEYEFGLRLPELLLMRIDRFSMSNSIEARVPFLDPQLVEFVYRLPLEHKLDRDVTKVVLRQAVADLVPDWVLQRPKQGFGAPVVDWLGSKLGTVFRRLLREDAIAAYFDINAVEEVLGDARNSAAFSLWPLMNFALWHVHWIEGRDLAPLIAESEP